MKKHSELFKERWFKMSLVEQMANIGSEVSRALRWKNKNNTEYRDKALGRAFELISLSLETKYTFAQYKELTRVREALVDYFYGENIYASSDVLWQKYFDYFGLALRKN